MTLGHLQVLNAPFSLKAMAIKELSADSVPKYLRAVDMIRKKSEAELWYRGIKKKRVHKLEPTLFRHPKMKSLSRSEALTQALQLERSLMDEIELRLPSFTDLWQTGRLLHPKDNWGVFFLMQHYRIPTRLLDWTSNPLAGLFFAVNGHDGKTDAAVWILDPVEWNGGLLADIGGQHRPLSTTDTHIKQYHPDESEKSTRMEPLAVHGFETNPRIVAQKGKFVVFGRSLDPMETWERKCPDWRSNRPALSRVTIPKNKVFQIRQMLSHYGMTHTTLFPDLEGLAMETIFKYGF